MLEGLKNKNKSVENNNTLGLDRVNNKTNSIPSNLLPNQNIKELLSLIPMEGGGGFLNKTTSTEDILATTTDSWIGVQPEEPVILPLPDLPIILPKPSVNCTDEHKKFLFFILNIFI
uniref:Uncharacterized protein n=1 Tax=Meloidogyne enterolobii TaxID=390850 RepID=A0A6V7VWD2_MELEN|nr:unnamed protein product [Meloidogyne enterolobii]